MNCNSAGAKMMRKLPIGIQSFEKLRTEGFVYVDKTSYVYQLVNGSATYFLGRPRRFGKSLFLSTLKAYFQGQKELFVDLDIATLEQEWNEYPVFHLDMNVEDYSSVERLEIGLNTNLLPLEEKWGRDEKETSSSARLLGLIRRAYENTGTKVVVLVDEYDKPLLQKMENGQNENEIRNRLKAFYGILKTADPYLRFVMLTGTRRKRRDMSWAFRMKKWDTAF
jgi:hypothetical protein